MNYNQENFYDINVCIENVSFEGNMENVTNGDERTFIIINYKTNKNVIC